MKDERGAIHVVGTVLILISVASSILVFDSKYRYQRLEEQLLKQAERIDALEKELRLLKGIR